MPYVAKKNESREKAWEELQAQPMFRVSYKELLGMPGMVDKLKFPHKTERSLGSRNDAWCEFHRHSGITWSDAQP